MPTGPPPSTWLGPPSNKILVTSLDSNICAALLEHEGHTIKLEEQAEIEISLSSGYMVSEYLSALCENLIWVCFTSHYLVIKVVLQYLKWCSFNNVNNLSFLCVQPMTDMKIRSARKRCMRSIMHIECQIRELAFVCYFYSEIKMLIYSYLIK